MGASCGVVVSGGIVLEPVSGGILLRASQWGHQVKCQPVGSSCGVVASGIILWSSSWWEHHAECQLV